MELLLSAFSRLLSMSLTALPVLAAVLAARWLLRKAPKKYSYGLWAAVGLRLACPWTLAQARWSLFNLPPLRQAAETAAVSGGAGGELIRPAFPLPVQGTAVSPPPAGMTMAAELSQTPSAGELALRAAALVWAAGVAAVLLYGAVSWLRLRRLTAAAVLEEPGVWACDGLGTPFVLGLFRPRVYIPFRLDGGQRTYVLAHERFHIRHLDHWVKALAYLLVAAYWWDPAVWLGWLLMCRDMEMRCDEAVLAKLGGGAREGYSLALVSFAAARRFPAALAFGEHDAARRVKNVLDWRRETPRMAFLALTAALAVVMACSFNGTRPESWVKVEGVGSGAAFTCDLREPIRSWAVYEDLYENGTLRSSVPRIVNGFLEDGAEAADGRFSASIRAQAAYAENGGFGGTLECWYDETAHWTVQLPKDHYTGAGGAVGDGEALGGAGGLRRTLTGNGEALLYSVLLSTEPGGAVTGYDRELGVTGTNDTVVQFRLVVSTKTAEAFGDGMDAARRLFELRSDGAAALLEALGLPGGYALPPAQTRNTLLVAFSEEPGDPDRLDGGMMDRAAVLLALMGDLERVEWSYPAAENGAETLKTVSFDRRQPDAWAESLGYEDIKDLGKSASGVRALLAYLGMDGGFAAGTAAGETPTGQVPYPAMGGVVGQVRYVLPEGTRTVGFQTETYDRGELTDRRWVWTGNVGEAFPASGRFWVTCAYDKGDWNRHLLWAVTPWTEDERGSEPLASFATDLPGFQRGARYPAYLRRPLETEGALTENGGAVLFAAFANERGGGSAQGMDPAALNDPGTLERAAHSDDVVILLRMCVSGEETTAEGLTSVTGLPTVSTEPFADILGFDGVRVTETLSFGWSERTYYAVDGGGNKTPIAESFGWGGPEDCAVDLDGDGQEELVCTVTYNADGAQRVYVYQRRADGVYRGWLDVWEELPADYVDWGVNSTWEEYDPAENVFFVHYAVDTDGDGEAEGDYARRTFTPAQALAAMTWDRRQS